MCCTCRRWHDYFLPELYHHITLTTAQPDQLAATLSQCDPRTSKPRGHFTRELDFRSLLVERQQILLLETIAKDCPYINAIHFDTETLSRVVVALDDQRDRTASPTLLTTSASDDIPSYSDTIRQQFPSFERSEIRSIAKAFCRQMFQRHPNVTTLTFSLFLSVIALQPDTLDFLRTFPTCLVHLTLDIHTEELTVNYVEFLHERCPHLESLSLTCKLMQEVVPRWLPTVQTNQTLKSFSLTSEAHQAYRHWSWVWYVGITYGKQLETAHFINLDERRDGSPYFELSPALAATFIPAFVQQHASTLKSLEMQNMASCRDVHEFWQQMQAQLLGMPARLVHLNCSDSQLSFGHDESVGNLIVGMFKDSVQQLYLSPRADIIDFEDFASLLGQCRNLKQLHLKRAAYSFQYPHQTTPLLPLLQHCLRLRQLDIRNCILVVEDGSIISRLTSLTLHNVLVTWTALNLALKRLPCLVTLGLCRATSIIIEGYPSPPRKAKLPTVTLSFPNPNMSISIDMGLTLLYTLPNYRSIDGTAKMITVSNTRSRHSWLIMTSDDTEVTHLSKQAERWHRKPPAEVAKAKPGFHLRYRVVLQCAHPIRDLTIGSFVIRKGALVSWRHPA
ncbi:hypothetical protein DM01DRAFT_1334041 [Hesseltinella vesiculosa]|uniref:Uncharacterized protein n=1 Tax=Hesseltinella vesiculosa TaxID=101127 RepID=A0A1X2GMR6_9FUNG|nr:hypothetical protein DM01DRAFT_1334041 [Hesseltinella vesiculosa]